MIRNACIVGLVVFAFQANGQKSDQLRSWPAVESLATSPRAWARARLK